MNVHGPHLLKNYYRDLQDARTQARELDNGPEDQDPRPDRIDLGEQQSIVTPDGFVLREANLLVWLRGNCQGSLYAMSQQGYERDREGCYAYPLELRGPGDTPFDPPDPVRVPPGEFTAAEDRFWAQWNQARQAPLSRPCGSTRIHP